MPHHHLDDDQVAALALSTGRAELLEEIMRTPATDATDATGADQTPDNDRTDRTDRTDRRRAARWLVPLAAAAVVVALVTIPLWTGSDDPSEVGTAADPAPVPTDRGALMVLEAPGWRVDDADGDGEEISYVNRGLTLQINAREASQYEDYVEDRSDIPDPAGPGEPVEILGLDAQFWAYSAEDHTAIREPEGGRAYEIRAEGMDEATYLDLLGELALVDQAEFEARLPDRFVTSAERPAVVQEMLDGIADALAPDHGLVPEGEPDPTVDSDGADRYDLGADVAGAVACRWIASYDAARASGDDVTADEAAEAMATTRTWPVLEQMEAEGAYPEVIHEYADDMVAGRGVTGFRQGLGCP